MATWQFGMHLVRNADIQKENYVTQSADFDEILNWHGNVLNEASLLELNQILPKEKSWSKEISQYGQLDSTVIECYYDQQGLQEITCRIDLRNVTEAELRGIISFANVNQAAFFIDGQIYKASLNQLTRLSRLSSAYKFCQNPLDFIENLAK